MSHEKNLTIFGAYVEQQGYQWCPWSDSNGGRIYLYKHFPWKRGSNKYILCFSRNEDKEGKVTWTIEGFGYPVTVKKLVDKFLEFVEPENHTFAFKSDTPNEPVTYCY